MSEFEKITYSEVNSIAGALAANAETMENILNAISGQLEKVGDDSVWGGGAAQEARAEFDRLKGKFPEFEQAVKDCADYLNKVVERYTEADAAVTGK